jgi:hypothetical protein
LQPFKSSKVPGVPKIQDIKAVSFETLQLLKSLKLVSRCGESDNYRDGGHIQIVNVGTPQSSEVLFKMSLFRKITTRSEPSNPCNF